MVRNCGPRAIPTRVQYGWSHHSERRLVRGYDRSPTHISFLQEIGWDLAASLQNPPQGGAHLTNLEAPNAIAFNPGFEYSNTPPGDFSPFNLVSIPDRQPKTSTYFVA